MKYILMDVEGTTSSIRFVHDVLFPYSQQRIGAFIREKSMDPAVQKIINELRSFLPANTPSDQITEKIIMLLKTWIKEDRKHPLLKELQGMIWKQGYEAGELKGHVYEDVPIAFENWRRKGIQLGIYSSGSVLAQQLLFGNSVFGNLNPSISNNFDTAVGPKRAMESYQEISRRLSIPADQIVFLSDTPEELQAAEKAGFITVQILREENQSSVPLRAVKDFLELTM